MISCHVDWLFLSNKRNPGPWHDEASALPLSYTPARVAFYTVQTICLNYK